MARGTATVLFTDLVSSTELAVQHGEAFDDARREHDAALRSAVETNHGTVVKGTGDGIMATFDGVGDGVLAARMVQQAIHRMNARRAAPALSVRVGVSVGDVSFEAGDCYGEPVVQAARLCALADGGQILATQVVRLLLGGPPADGFEDAGARELRGLPGVVDVVEIRWEVPEVSATPLPSRLVGALPSFVGRVDELALLDEAFAAVRERRERRTVLLGGEPGVGKTTVAVRSVRRWFDAGATAAMGHCDEDVRSPYQPFVEAFEHLVATSPVELLEAHVGRHGRSLLPLAPSLASRVRTLPEVATTDRESERYLLFAAAGDLLTAIGELTPVVLLLDDLHWADGGTTSLLRSLAAAADPARVLVVGTLRTDELSGDHPMAQALAAFRRIPGVIRVQVGGLGRPDVVDLVQHWTGAGGAEGTERLADALVAETGGNAFFVTELVRHLDETGQLADLADAPPTGRDLVPDSIREVLAARIARLGTVGDQVLAAAAVVGTEFTIPLVAAVSGVDEVKLLGLLAEASSAALVREVVGAPGRFAFTHALVQHAILADLGLSRASTLHRRVAEVLEDEHVEGDPVGVLAHHWLQATNVPDSARARDWAREAGDAAVAALAPEDAVAFYRQALLLHDQLRGSDQTTRIDLLIQLGTAERQAGDPEHRDTLLKACRLAVRSGDVGRLARAALANNSGTFSRFQGVDHERVEALETAVAGAVDPAQRALLLGTLANELTYSGDFDRRRVLADEAMQAARSTGDDALLLRVGNLVFYALWIPDTLGERLALTRESVALVQRVDDPLARFWAATASSLNLVQAGDLAAATPFLDATLELAERLAQPALRWRALHTEATRLLLAGDPDAAEPFAREAFEVGDGAGEREAGVYWKSQQMCLHWQRGTLVELSDRISGAAPRRPNAEASLCLIRSEAGRPDDVVALLDRGVAGTFSAVPRDPAFVASVAMFAEGAIAVRHRRSAAALHDLLAPFADQVGFDGVMTVGALEHHLGGLAGVLGRYDEAVDRLERAVARHTELGAPFFEARSRFELARARLARGAPGDAPSAQDELVRAIALADELGYTAVADRATALARLRGR